MKYKIVESVNKKENINHPVDDNFTLSEELLDIKSEKIDESVETEKPIEEDYEYSEYDKKLLVNRAKTLAKQISDLYNSNQVEAQGELPSENEIAKALLDSPKKIDMYAKFLSKIKGTNRAESIVEKLVKELMSFKKKLSMIKKPQPATESMNEAVEELSDEEKKEIIDALEEMIESGETSCECWDEPTKVLVKSELRKRGLKFNVSGNDRGNKFSYHIEWWNPKTESMNENQSVYAMSPDQMSDWNDICKAFAKKVGAELVFVNETSCGLEFPDGSMKHVYIDEMIDYLGGMNESLLMEKAVPEEDRYVNDLIKGIVNKRYHRANAKLEPAEQRVADKYGITSEKGRFGNTTKVGQRELRYIPTHNGSGDINYADMARKGVEREKKNKDLGISPDDFSEYRSGVSGSREKKGHNTLTQSRAKLNRDLGKDYLYTRQYSNFKKEAEKDLANVDADFDKRKAGYIDDISRATKALANVENEREAARAEKQGWVDKFKNAQKDIINKHRKNKNESLNESVDTNGICGERVEFESGEEMLDALKSGSDFYNINTGDYVFGYNDSGSIAVYSLDLDEALELQNSPYRDCGTYWGGLLGVGGYIYDDESYEDRNEYAPTNKDFCDDNYATDGWIELDYYCGPVDEACGSKKKSKKKNLKESVEDDNVIWKSDAQYEYWSDKATKDEILDQLEANDFYGVKDELLDEDVVESAFDECYEEMLENGLEAGDFDTEEKADLLVEYGMREWDDLIDIEKGRDFIIDDDWISGGEGDFEDLQNMFDSEYGEFTDYSNYDTIYVVGDYQRWDGGHRVSAVFENGLADAVKRVCYPGYDNTATLYKDENGNLTFTESSHDAPMGGTSLNFYCLTDDNAEFDSVDEAIESGVLIPVKVNW